MFELFVAGTNDAARVASVGRRLGPFPPGAALLGPRQKACMEAARGAQVLSRGPSETFGQPEIVEWKLSLEGLRCRVGRDSSTCHVCLLNPPMG